jgi:hypothetical protein
MLRKATSLFLIWGFFLLSGNFQSRVSAQAQNNLSPNKQTIRVGENISKPDLKEILDREIAKSKFDHPELTADFKKLEKESVKVPAKRRKLSGKDKTLLVLFFVGIAVMAVLVAKYGTVPDCDEVTCDDGENPCPCN